MVKFSLFHSKVKPLTSATFLQCQDISDLQQWDDATMQHFIAQSFDNNDMPVLRHFFEYFSDYSLLITECRQRSLSSQCDSSKFFSLFRDLKRLPNFLFEDWWEMYDSTSKDPEDKQRWCDIGVYLSFFTKQLEASPWLATIPKPYMQSLLDNDYHLYDRKPHLRFLHQLQQKKKSISLEWLQSYAEILTWYDDTDHDLILDSFDNIPFVSFRLKMQERPLRPEEWPCFKENINILFMNLNEDKPRNPEALQSCVKTYISWLYCQNIQECSYEEEHLTIGFQSGSLICMLRNGQYVFRWGPCVIKDQNYILHCIKQIRIKDFFQYIYDPEEMHDLADWLPNIDISTLNMLGHHSDVKISDCIPSHHLYENVIEENIMI